jgi:hypothetical protein
MLVKIGLRTRPILLWYAAKHKSARYAKVIQPIGMNSLQPDIPGSTSIPVIMVETVAPRLKRIAPHEVQSSTLSMLRFGSKQDAGSDQTFSVMKWAVSDHGNRRICHDTYPASRQ